MNKLILILLLFFISPIIIKAQDQDYQKYYVGGYYTLLVDPYIMESTNDSIEITQHFINVNFRNALGRNWRIGVEYIVSLVSYEGIEDPFQIFGLTIDYDVLRAKKSKLNLRAGLSMGNLLYAGDFEPKRRSVVNRIIGISYEYKISKIVWLNAGLYGHRPLNNIPGKYALAQPFLGACVGFY